MRIVSGLVCLTAALAVVLPTAGGQEPKRSELLAAVEKQLKQTAATVGPSIATVVVSRSEFYPKPPADAPPGKLGAFDPKEFLKKDPTPERAALAVALDLSDPKLIPNHGYAGGIVIDPAGLVLTPYHVIDGATRVFVYLPGGKGSYADIHAADSRSDLAVLKLIAPPPNLKAARFAAVETLNVRGRTPNVETGKLCVLMANPYSAAFGIGQPSAAFGSITNVRYRAPGKGRETVGRRYTEYGTLLEYDVRLNAGMTGGALLNLDGEVIGLTNSAAVAWGNEVGPGYAVPADEYFRRTLEVLRRGEEVEYGFLGVSQSRDFGWPRIDVTAGGPAARAGIQPGDEIVSVNGIATPEFDDLLLHIGSALAGTKVKVSLAGVRGERAVEVTIAKFKNDQPFIASARPDPVFGLRVDYESINSGAPAERPPPRFAGRPATWPPPAVCIREVAPNSPAAEKFKVLGDTPQRWLVTHVDGNVVTTPAEFYKAAKGAEKVKLTLIDPNEPERPRELTLP